MDTNTKQLILSIFKKQKEIAEETYQTVLELLSAEPANEDMLKAINSTDKSQ